MPYLHARPLQKSWCPCASCERLFYIRISKYRTDWAKMKGSNCRAGGGGSHILKLCRVRGSLPPLAPCCSIPARLLVAFKAQLTPAASQLFRARACYPKTAGKSTWFLPFSNCSWFHTKKCLKALSPEVRSCGQSPTCTFSFTKQRSL